MVSKGDGWLEAQTMFGMTTYYRLVEGKLYCKVQGEFQNCVIFDQMAVIREGDLYNTWAPFVSKSSLLKRFSDTEMAAHFTLSMPVLVRSVVLRVLSFTRFSSINPRPLTGRDAVVMGYCVDMSENDQILLMADSVDAIPGVELPPKPSSWLPTDRMDVQKFRCLIDITGPTSGRVILSAILDPKTNLPAALINFATQKLVGVLVYLLQEAARKVSANPVKNPHAQKIREEAFYREWLLPRTQWYCRKKGWQHSKIAALDGLVPPTPRTPALTPDGPHGSGPTPRQPQPPATSDSIKKPLTKAEKEEKRKKLIFSGFSWFRSGKKGSGEKPASLAAKPAAAPTILEAITPRWLLPTPKKTVRTPHTNRQSPFKRAGNPWMFAFFVVAFFAVKNSAVMTAAQTHIGFIGELLLTMLLFQAAVYASSVYGFFDPTYAARLFDGRREVTLAAAMALLVCMGCVGGLAGAAFATFKTYKIVLIPRDASADAVQDWSYAASTVLQRWCSLCFCCFVLLVVKPEAFKRLIK
jgi:hypothetical protein